jgi:sugar lactone lactonase YvrE
MKTAITSCCALRPTPVGWMTVGALVALLLAGTGPLGAGEGQGARFLLAWGTKGDAPGEFYSPIGIAVSRKDEVYVTDLNNGRVQKFTADGQYLGGFDLPRDRPDGRASVAGGIAVNAAGLIYVSFMQQHKVRVYAASGRLVGEFGQRGAGDGELYGPGGMVLAPDGTLYVADQQNHRVQRFTTDGRFLGRWGGYGSGAGQFGGAAPVGSRFGGPHFLARDSQGRLYTTEGTVGRVQQLTAEGAPLAAWGDKGDQPGVFGAYPFGRSTTFGPVAILVDRHDRVWVSSLNDRVQLFTTDGRFLLGLGGSGTGPGQFSRPHGLALDSRGHLYVADAANQRIQKFEIPEP